ncbi:hypothetical protein P7C70_g6439, partial [Phenoliferia sp. Uapishka_3]
MDGKPSDQLAVFFLLTSLPKPFKHICETLCVTTMGKTSALPSLVITSELLQAAVTPEHSGQAHMATTTPANANISAFLSLAQTASTSSQLTCTHASAAARRAANPRQFNKMVAPGGPVTHLADILGNQWPGAMQAHPAIQYLSQILASGLPCQTLVDSGTNPKTSCRLEPGSATTVQIYPELISGIAGSCMAIRVGSDF